MNRGIINDRDVSQWVKQYGDTYRVMFIHPIDVEYIGRNSMVQQPINDALYNIDCEHVDEVKNQYLRSKTFTDLKEENQISKMRMLGLSPELRLSLSTQPRFRKLFSEFGDFEKRCSA